MTLLIGADLWASSGSRGVAASYWDRQKLRSDGLLCH